MTVEEMRTELGLGPDVPAIDVVAAWVAAHQAIPPAELITLAEAKAHLRVTSSAEDVVIQGMLDAAIGALDGPEGWLGRSLFKVTREARLHWCGDCLRLPYPPIVDVISIEAFSGDAWSVLDTAAWRYDDARLDLINSPVGTYRVVYTAGYDVLPKPLRSATLLMLTDLYLNRGTSIPTANASKVPMSTTVEALLGPYQVYR